MVGHGTKLIPEVRSEIAHRHPVLSARAKSLIPVAVGDADGLPGLEVWIGNPDGCCDASAGLAAVIELNCGGPIRHHVQPIRVRGLAGCR